MASKRYRLDKLLGFAGIGRAEAKKRIVAGRVSADGRIILDPGEQVDGSCRICMDGVPLLLEEQIYLMVNKPAGVLTATRDPSVPTIMSLLPEQYARRALGPVGRLDKDVTGMVLMTTDGELTHRLISPKWKAEKVYCARCKGRLTEEDVCAFREGIELSDFTALPSKLRILKASEEESTAEAVLSEGKYHQVKRMFAAVGHPLLSLKRESIGGVQLDPALPEGGYRPLTFLEIERLRQITGLSTEEAHEEERN